MIHALTRTTAVIVGSTILATLTVNAVDIRGHAVTTYLGALLIEITDEAGACPDTMVLVDQALVPFCVDMYEASPGDECPYQDPATGDETSINMAEGRCLPVSRPHVTPWRNVTQVQAHNACVRAGKRLLSSDEWYKVALGTSDQTSALSGEHCNIASNRADGAAPTGSGMRCVSDVGAYDMIGNVWEWVDGVVARGVWDGQEVPPTGYVQAVNLHGMPITTGTAIDERFNGDRFWSDHDIDAGLMRGGYYASEGNAGVHTVYAASPPIFYGDAVGFRCAQTVHREE